MDTDERGMKAEDHKRGVFNVFFDFAQVRKGVKTQRARRILNARPAEGRFGTLISSPIEHSSIRLAALAHGRPI